MYKRILLTGATGFVGSCLAPALAAAFPAATLTMVAANTLAGATGVDLLDPEAVGAMVRAARPDLVVHLAGQASVAGSITSVNETWAVNCTGSLLLASAIAEYAPEATLLFTSSSEVYGASFLAGIVDESSPLVPMNPYAKSKALAETIFRQRLPDTTKVIVARPFNHTGPGQRDDFVLPSFAGQVARIEAGVQAPSIAVGDLDVRRDFLDVRDIVAAYVALVAAAPGLPSRFTVNIASGSTYLLRDLLDTLRGLSRVPFDVTIDPARLRPNDLPVATGSSALMRLAVGWRPVHPIEETLDRLLEAARSKHR